MNRYIINEKTKTIHKKPNKDSKCPAVKLMYEENKSEFSTTRLKKEIKRYPKLYSFCDRCMPYGKEDIK